MRLTGAALILGLVIWLVLASRPTPEPVWQGHPLSEWLDAFDCHLRFEVGDGRRGLFSDAEIDQALQGIGQAALPIMYDWLTSKPARWKEWCNVQLNRLPMTWTRFRFQNDALDLQCLAETGFMYYGTNAQPLLPALIKLSHNMDPELRMAAYEAAFFTRPNEEIFLPLASRALKEDDKDVQAMARQWQEERFPDAVGRPVLNQSQ